MKVAMIGSGLQCQRRAPVITHSKGHQLKVIAGRTLESAKEAGKKFGAEVSGDWREVVRRPDIDAVLVCTPPHLHAEISIAAMKAGKHVLCEKPLAKTLAEADRMIKTVRSTKRIFKCGYNHRHHPAIQKAKQHLDSGDLGKVIYARCRYGICGRPGYEKEWRADPASAAGGQLMEQGVHAMDLFRWFIGDFDEAVGMTGIQYFTKQSLDDNGMALFRSRSGAMAMLHTSLTQWKNLFSFEVFGTEGYVVVEGLGSSYGTEKIIFGKRDFTGPFQTKVTEFRGRDISWKAEWEEFVAAVRENRQPLGNVEDGREAMRMALAVYQSEKTSRFVSLKKKI